MFCDYYHGLLGVQFFGRVACDGHFARLRGMFVLAMTALLIFQQPPILRKQSEYVPDLHEI